MSTVQILLLPFSLLYGIGVSFRNWLYQIGVFKTTRFNNQYIISVGNLAVGGSGKTPHVEYLVKLLGSKKKAILSRGYKRYTTGVVIADKDSTYIEIGDEPAQYVYKFFPETSVVVAEKRVKGVKEILDKKPENEVVILDDAYQHRALYRDLNILITDYGKPFYADHMLPSGRLREWKSAAKRADAIVVSKCPSDFFRDILEVEIEAFSAAPIFYSRYEYGKLQFLNGNEISKDVCLLTGIAKASGLKERIGKEYTLHDHFDFPDHHDYTEKELRTIAEQSKGSGIITTEKDATKLSTFHLPSIFGDTPVAYIPIEVSFFGSEFDEFVRSEMK